MRFKLYSQIQTGSTERDVKQGWVAENKQFSNFMRHYLENGKTVRDYEIVQR